MLLIVNTFYENVLIIVDKSGAIYRSSLSLYTYQYTLLSMDKTIVKWLKTPKKVSGRFVWNLQDVDEIKAIGKQADLYPDTYFYEMFINDTGSKITKNKFTRILAAHGYSRISKRFQNDIGASSILKAYRHVGTHDAVCVVCKGSGFVKALNSVDT